MLDILNIFEKALSLHFHIWEYGEPYKVRKIFVRNSDKSYTSTATYQDEKCRICGKVNTVLYSRN